MSIPSPTSKTTIESTWGQSVATVLNNLGTVSIVTLSRAVNTNYQNTTGRPMLVLVTSDFFTTAATEACVHGGFIGATSPPITTFGEAGTTDAMGAGHSIGTVVMVVPNNYYYRITETTTGGAFTAIYNWVEVTL